VSLKTDTGYKCLLRVRSIQESSLIPKHLPPIGQEINTVVANFVEEILYVSARPSDISTESIQKWQLYYDFIDTLEIGSEIQGTVSSSQPFGIFVDISAPYIGLIDVGHTGFSGGDPLPQNRLDWPAKGEGITCQVSYFRLWNKQIGLGWINPCCNGA
jgi:transcriptional accessory protein Tex/SPT6